MKVWSKKFIDSVDARDIKHRWMSLGWIAIAAIAAYKAANEGYHTGTWAGMSGVLKKSVPSQEATKDPIFNDYIEEKDS